MSFIIIDGAYLPLTTTPDFVAKQVGCKKPKALQANSLTEVKPWLKDLFYAGALWNIWCVMYRVIEIDHDWFFDQYEEKYGSRSVGPLALTSFEEFYKWCIELEKEII